MFINPEPRNTPKQQQIPPTFTKYLAQARHSDLPFINVPILQMGKLRSDKAKGDLAQVKNK